MHEYKVEYFYLATGMEGRPDIRTFVEFADDPLEAEEKVARRMAGDNKESYDWCLHCLTATEVDRFV